MKEKKEDLGESVFDFALAPAAPDSASVLGIESVYDYCSRIEITFTFSNYRLDFGKINVMQIIDKYLLKLSGMVYRFIAYDEKELFIDDVKTAEGVAMPMMLQEDLPGIFISFAVVFENCKIVGSPTQELNMNDLGFYFRQPGILRYGNFEPYFQFINTEAEYINIPTAREVYITNSNIFQFYVRNIFDIYLENSSVSFVSDMPIDNLSDLAPQRGNQELLVKLSLPADTNTQLANYWWNRINTSFGEFIGKEDYLQDYKYELYECLAHGHHASWIFSYVREVDKLPSSSAVYTISSRLSLLKTMFEGTYIHKDENSSCTCFSDATGFCTVYGEDKTFLLTDYGAYVYNDTILRDKKQISRYSYSDLKQECTELFVVLPYRENYFNTDLFDESTVKMERLIGDTNSIYVDTFEYFERK